MKRYKIMYGFMSHRENTIEVVCKEEDVETVAYAIYNGYVGDKLGVLVVSDGKTEKVLMDRM